MTMEYEANKATKCPMCGAEALIDGARELSRTINGRTYTATVSAQVCSQCGESLISHHALGRFESAISRALMSAGMHDGESLKWMRKSAGLRAADLAELLGITPKTVSRWETDETPIDRAALLVLGRLAVDAGEGQSGTAEALRAMARPLPKAPRKVALGVI